MISVFLNFKCMVMFFQTSVIDGSKKLLNAPLLPFAAVF